MALWRFNSKQLRVFYHQSLGVRKWFHGLFLKEYKGIILDLCTNTMYLF